MAVLVNGQPTFTHPWGHYRPPLPIWRAWACAGGLLTLVLALLSPIHAFDSMLFSLHMVEHLLLMLVAAPLLLLGAPVLPLLWGLPETERIGFARLFLVRRSPIHRACHILSHPLVAEALFVATVGLWHVPALYDAAQGPTPVHTLEHVLFFASSALYWWGIIHPSGGQRRLGDGMSIVYLLPPLLEGTLIGALLTFAGQPVYATYRAAPRLFGLSALEDQQLAGLIMWIPTGLVYLAALLILLGLFFLEEEGAERLAPVPG